MLLHRDPRWATLLPERTRLATWNGIGAGGGRAQGRGQGREASAGQRERGAAAPSSLGVAPPARSGPLPATGLESCSLRSQGRSPMITAAQRRSCYATRSWSTAAAGSGFGRQAVDHFRKLRASGPAQPVSWQRGLHMKRNHSSHVPEGDLRTGAQVSNAKTTLGDCT